MAKLEWSVPLSVWCAPPGRQPPGLSPGADTFTGSSLEIRVDATFRAPGDQRDLGVVLLAAGFVPE